MDEELWDIARVAEYLGVTERTVYNKVRAGDLPAVKIGRLWRVRLSDLEAWLAEGSVRASRRADTVMQTGASERGPYPYPSATEQPLEVREGATVPSRDDLEALLAPLDDMLARRLAFVGLLTAAVEALGWPAPIIVGGNAVEFHTAGGYTTVDIDLVGATEPIAQVLGEWGFTREGRHWYDEPLGLLVETPGGQLEAAALERVVRVSLGPVQAYVLGTEDLIVDRLNACVHWGHEDSCLWAAALLKESGIVLDVAYLRARACEEALSERLEELLTEAGLS